MSEQTDKIQKTARKRQRLQNRQWAPNEVFETLSYMRDLKIQGQEPQVSVNFCNFLCRT